MSNQAFPVSQDLETGGAVSPGPDHPAQVGCGEEVDRGGCGACAGLEQTDIAVAADVVCGHVNGVGAGTFVFEFPAACREERVPVRHAG